MKKHYFHQPIYLLIFFFAFPLVAQNNHQHLDNEGGGHDSANQQECIIESTYQLMQNRITKNVDSLQRINQLPSASSRSIVRFSWPLRQATGFNDPSYYFISNYVDVDQTSGRMRDYRCNQQTYDNHKGIDIVTWPFKSYKQTANAVEVIAAASGVIIDKNDGAFDENCTQRNGAVANFITIRHSDGSIAFYYHLKKYSLTNKIVGDYVSEGSYLGVVGSSGFSTDPHLHFEVWSDQSFTNLIDPYSGSCNTLNGSSWWKNQKPYKEMKINKIMTHHSEPNQPNCPYNGEVRAAADEFEPGDRIYFSIHLAHENGGTKYFTIYHPNGTIWDSWSQNKGTYNYSSWWFWRRTLPSNASSGNWRYEVSYKGQRITHTFKVKGQSNPCSNINTIQCGQTINSNTINGTNDFETSDYAGCYSGASSFNGNDKIYKVTLSNTGNLNIKLSGLSRDLDLFLLSGCGSNKRCLAKSTKSGTTIDEINYSNARGTYYIVIDGYNSTQNSNFQLSVNCGCTCPAVYDPVCGADGKTYGNSCEAECAGVTWTRGECSTACQCTSQYDDNICDDFDSYTYNRKIGPQSSCWTTWTGQEGGSQDAYVLRSNSTGNQYIKIEGTNSNGGGPHDVVLKLGDKRSGVYELKFDLWTFRGDKGYYNIQHRFSTGSNNNQWASNVYFDGNGGGYLLVQNRRYSFSYSTSRWVEIRQYIDLNRDQTTLYVGGRKVHDWRFSAQATTTSSGTRQLSAIDFYPIDNSYEFYIDDVKLTKVSNFVTEDHLGDSRTNTTKSAPIKTILPTTTLEKTSMTLFPNPTNNVVNVTLAGFDNQAVSMILFNMIGQKVYQQSIHNSDGSPLSIAVDHLPKGTYILRANGTSGQQQQQKLVIF